MTISQHATVNPVFLYRDCSAAIAWLIRVYGFEQHELHQAPDGPVVHAELRFGDAGIGLSAAGPAAADNPWSMVRSGIYVRSPKWRRFTIGRAPPARRSPTDPRYQLWLS